METARRSDRYSLSRRSVLAGALGVAGTVALAACSSAGTASSSAKKPTIEPKADGNLSWFSWSGYVDPTIVSDFEKKYGVTVTISTFDSNDAMIEKLAAGLPYDLITDNSAYMYESIQGGLVQPFDLKALPEYSQLDPYFRKPSYDGGTLQYSVPYSGGGTGILWRTDKVRVDDPVLERSVEPPRGQGPYLRARLRTGRHRRRPATRGLQPQFRRCLPGKQRHQCAHPLKPDLGGISSDTLTNIGNGNAWIAQSWVPDAISVMTKSNYADKLQFEFTPKQGIPFGMDVLSIGANAASPGTAMLFINWMLTPEMSARNAAYTGQASGTIAGDAAFQKVVKDFPAFADGVPYDKALWRLSATGARQTLWTQQWNRFVA